jgi:hypothetical protein
MINVETSTAKLRIILSGRKFTRKLFAFILQKQANFYFVVVLLLAPTAPSEPGPPHSRGLWVTHNALQSAGLLGTSD